jgi:hypothetical protein
MFKRGLKTFLKYLIALMFLLAVFLVFERVRGQLSLANYRRQLITKGEKLGPNDFISYHPPKQNGAPVVCEATRQLIKGPVLPDHYPPKMSLTPAGHAIVGFRESEWVEEKITNHWEQLALDLKTNEAVLERIHLALKKPVFNNELDYSLGCKMPITNLTTVKF